MPERETYPSGWARLVGFTPETYEAQRSTPSGHMFVVRATVWVDKIRTDAGQRGYRMTERVLVEFSAAESAPQIRGAMRSYLHAEALMFAAGAMHADAELRADGSAPVGIAQVLAGRAYGASGLPLVAVEVQPDAGDAEALPFNAVQHYFRGVR